MRNHRLLTLAPLVALSVACEERSGPLAAEHTPSVGDSVAFHQLQSAIQRGDIEAAKLIVPDLPPGATVLPDSQLSTLTSDPATWGRAHIREWRFAAKIGDPNSTMDNYAYAWMVHNGHVGEARMTVTLRDAQGNVLQSCCTYAKRELNRLGPILYQSLMYSTNLRPATACGHSIDGRAEFNAWFLPWIPLRWDPYGPSGEQRGLTAKGDGDNDAQPPCPPEEEQPDTDGDGGGDDSGGGGTDGGGGTPGSTYAISACVYLDWFHGDGTYWYTEFLGCETITLEV